MGEGETQTSGRRGSLLYFGALIVLGAWGFGVSATGEGWTRSGLLALALALVSVALTVWRSLWLASRELPVALSVSVGLLTTGLLGIVPITNWPVRLSHAWARSELDVLATRVRAGETLNTPARAGLFIIERTEIRADTVCLWVYMHPNGPSGLAHAPGRPTANAWSEFPLGGGWWLVEED